MIKRMKRIRLHHVAVVDIIETTYVLEDGTEAVAVHNGTATPNATISFNGEYKTLVLSPSLASKTTVEDKFLLASAESLG